MHMQRIEAPAFDSDRGSIQPSNYLLQEGRSNVLLHRELDAKEIPELLDDGIFKYKGRTYLAVIATFPTKDKALAAVHSYWKAARMLKEKGA